jgi:hypothetical protein
MVEDRATLSFLRPSAAPSPLVVVYAAGAGKPSAGRKLRQGFNEFLTRPSLFLIWCDHPDVVWCHRKMNYATELSQGQKR